MFLFLRKWMFVIIYGAVFWVSLVLALEMMFGFGS